MMSMRKFGAALAKRPVTFGSDTKVGQQIRQAVKPTEEMEQMAVIEWAGMQRYGCLPLACYLHHSPNGGYRHKAVNSKGQTYCPEGAKLKRMGSQKGWPDLHLVVARGGFHSLFIEMKVKGGTVSMEQKTIHALLQEEGHRVSVCWSAGEAIKEIRDYLGMD